MKRAVPARELAIFCAIVLGAGAFVVAVRTRAGWDQDIWWHLATGRWIIQHGQVPAADPFSQYGHDKPWVAYSWLFGTIAYGAHAIAGLRGIVLLSATMGALIAAACYTLLRRCGATLFRAVPLTAAAFYAIMPLTTPRPWLFSILFFLIEVHLIVAGQRSRTRLLWLLPIVFALWANLHIQFALGLVVLLAAILDAVWAGTDKMMRRHWIGVGVACAVATLLNPYHVGIYLVAFDYMGQTELFTRIGEFVAPTFRTTPDWVVLAFVLTAAGCLGWQLRERAFGLFLPLLFLLGAWLGFRSQRDTWMIVITAALIMSRTAWRAAARNDRAADASRWVGTLAATATAALLLLFAALPLREETLEANVARSYPVDAAAFIETRGAAGPLYNYFDWGGYLIWRLPQNPAAMDGRTIVHGEARILRHVDTWQGRPGWRDDPELSAAQIVIGPRDQPLASLLRLDDRFKLVYEDRAGPAVVFEAK